MYTLDIAMFVILALAWGLLACGRARMAFFASFAAIAAGVVAITAFHWQAVPALLAALVAAAAAAIDWRRRWAPRRLWRGVGLGALAAAMLGAALPYHYFPMFRLPEPDGRFAVGVTRLELVDSSRRGVLEDGPSDPRRVMVQLWYPADASKPGRYATYIPRDRAVTEAISLARNMGLRPFQLLHLASVETHSLEDASPAAAEKGFPLVVFNHGYSMYPAQNVPLFEHLASHGYVVASIGHVYDGASSQFADGRSWPTTPLVVTPDFSAALGSLVKTMDVEHWSREMPSYAAALARDRLSRSAVAWRGDTRFVTQSLERGSLPPLARKIAKTIDFERLSFGGMSFGGGVAVQSCEDEIRCRAAFSLDGVTYDPAMFDKDVRAPLLAFYSDWVRFPLFEGQPRDARIQPGDFTYRRWIAVDRPDDIRLRIVGTGHMSFTDLLPMLRRPAPSPYDGSMNPARMDGILGDFTLAFLDHYVEGHRTGFPNRQLADYPEVVRHDPRVASAASTRPVTAGTTR